MTAATPLWRDLTVGLSLPDAAFGAAIDIDGLLVEPDLHYTATAESSRLLLMPRAGTFTRLLLEWETLPEIGIFSATSFPADAFDSAELARLETWMRDAAFLLHSHRDLIRGSAERAVADAASGRDTSLPRTTTPSSHVVSVHVGTRVGEPFETGDAAQTYDQHIFRELLFDDLWQAHVHLLAGLDAPASITYL